MENLNILIIGGLIVGGLLGVTMQHSKFCMAAIVSNFVIMRDYRQMHAYLVAISVALIGTQVLDFTGIVSLSDSRFLSGNIDWLSTSIGGLCFGFGTILAGGCIGRMVVRMGEGNLSAVFVLITISIVGASTLFGILEPFRLTLKEIGTINLAEGDGTLTQLLDIPVWGFTVFIVLLSALIIKMSGQKARSPRLLVAGSIIGLLVTLAWWITGYLSQDIDTVHRPASVGYITPIVHSAVILGVGKVLSDGAYFGVAILSGTLLGSFISAWRSKNFHWVSLENSQTKRLFIGGMLMGFGAILAGGCNIGQGLTGISTCSIAAIMTLIWIFLGMRIGLAWLLWKESFPDRRRSHRHG